MKNGNVCSVCSACGKVTSSLWYGYLDNKEGRFCDDCLVKWRKYAKKYGLKIIEGCAGIDGWRYEKPHNEMWYKVARIWKDFTRLGMREVVEFT